MFSNTKFHVYCDHIIDPRGFEVPDYLVVAPHTDRRDLITGVCVLPIWENRIVLLDMYRHAVGARQLEAPRGFVDGSEDPPTAAIRELEEETGLVCHPDKLTSLGICAHEGSTIAGRLALFAATDCRTGGCLDESEIGLGKLTCLNFDGARHLLTEMKLEDAVTSLALHRFFITFLDRTEGQQSIDESVRVSH